MAGEGFGWLERGGVSGPIGILIRHPVSLYCVMPSWFRIKASANALSLRASYRPEAPPCPAAMLVFRRRTLSSVFNVRSFATYFAGSQYITWLSLNEVRTSRDG